MDGRLVYVSVIVAAWTFGLEAPPVKESWMLGKLRGRAASAASTSWNVGKTLFQTSIFWLIFLVFIPASIWILEDWLGLAGWRFASTSWRIGGAALFGLGSTLGITSGVVMAVAGRGTPLPADCPRELVVVGPYRYIRNPMVIAGLSQGIAVGLFLGSPCIVAYALAGGPVWNLFVRPWEEADLEERFGLAYRQYREAVRCWRPMWRPYCLRSATHQSESSQLPHAR